VSNKANVRRPGQRVRHESRWGRRVGEVQRRPRPVVRSARAANKAELDAKPTFAELGATRAAMLAVFDALCEGGAT
jgi:hypothetical protein